LQVQTNNLELELMLACARWPQRDSDRQLISDLAENVKDWRRFVLLTKHHRIVPLVSRNLQSALNTSASSRAQPAVTELKDASANMAMRSLVLLSELRRVMVALRASGIAVRVLKGFPLAQLVYGDIGLRAPGDLDVLIESSQLLPADEVIRGLGYTGLLDPRRFNRRQLAFYRTHWKDITYTDSAPSGEALWPKLLQGAAASESALLGFAQPNAVIMHSRRWYWLSAQLTSQWPMFGQPGIGGVAAGENVAATYGHGARGVLPNGMVAIADNNIGTTLGAGTEDQLFVVSTQECHLWEDPSAPVFLRCEQPSAANLGVLLVLYGYFAYSFRRYPNANSVIGGSGMISPAF